MDGYGAWPVPRVLRDLLDVLGRGVQVTLSHPAAIMERLEQIERDLAERENEYGEAAGARARLVRDWEKRLARATAGAKGSDANARKQAALVLAAEQDGLYDDLREAEGAFAALHAVVRVMEQRATIGMALLKTQGRS